MDNCMGIAYRRFSARGFNKPPAAEKINFPAPFSAGVSKGVSPLAVRRV